MGFFDRHQLYFYIGQIPSSRAYRTLRRFFLKAECKLALGIAYDKEAITSLDWKEAEKRNFLAPSVEFKFVALPEGGLRRIKS